jgi:uncharacterized Tic20 family protein
MSNDIFDQDFENFEDLNFRPWGMEINTFCMLMHLAQFASFIIPIAGIVLPIVMWATNKDQSRTIDIQGKIILNWAITVLIIAVVGIFIPFLNVIILLALAVVNIVFPILGAVKANEGVIYEYPFSLKLIK